MKKTFKIKIGNELKINKIGVFVGFFGILITLLILTFFVSGTLLPKEMKLIYFVEVIGRNFYIALLISILTSFIGFKISDLRSYTNTNLILEKDKISFLKKGELIELPKWKINKVSKKKNLISKIERIKIKTVTFKEYDLKANSGLFSNLTEMFPSKKKIIKTLGNTVQRK